MPDVPDDFAKATKEPWAPVVLDEVTAAYADADWKADELKAAVAGVAEAHGLKLAKAQAPVRRLRSPSHHVSCADDTAGAT